MDISKEWSQGIDLIFPLSLRSEKNRKYSILVSTLPIILLNYQLTNELNPS